MKIASYLKIVALVSLHLALVCIVVNRPIQGMAFCAVYLCCALSDMKVNWTGK